MDAIPEAMRGPTSPNRSLIAILAFGVAATALFIVCWMWPGDETWWGPGTSAILAYAFFAFHLAVSGRYLNALDPGIWVPVMILLYWFGLPVAIGLGSGTTTYENWSLTGFDRPPQLPRAFAAALLSFACFMFGWYLAGRRNLNVESTPASPADRDLFSVGLALLCGGLLMTAVGTILAGPSLIFGAYRAMTLARNLGEFDPRFVFTGIWFAQGGVYALLASYDGKSWLRLIPAAGGGFLIFVFLVLTGDRGGLSAFLPAAGLAYVTRVRRLPRWPIVLGFLGALILMPMMKEYREFKSMQVTERARLSDLVLAAFGEMGSDIGVYCYTLEMIPSRKNYDYGMTFVDAALKTIPNVGVTQGKSFMLDPLKHTPSKWVTFTANPLAYINTGGRYGYAIAMEWYFNFGLVGVYLGMIATGYLTARVRNSASGSGIKLVWSCLFYSMIILTVRNNIAGQVKSGVWPLIGVISLRFVFSKLWGSTPARGTLVVSPNSVGEEFATSARLSGAEVRDPH